MPPIKNATAISVDSLMRQAFVFALRLSVLYIRKVTTFHNTSMPMAISATNSILFTPIAYEIANSVGYSPHPTEFPIINFSSYYTTL